MKWDEMDRYKRILGNVYRGKEWVNLELVKAGLPVALQVLQQGQDNGSGVDQGKGSQALNLVGPQPDAPVGFQAW